MRVRQALPELTLEENSFFVQSFCALVVASPVGVIGFEPTDAPPQVIADSPVTATPAFPLAHTLAHEMQIDPDLGRLIDAWPTLSPTVKRMILAALEAIEPSK